MLDKPRKFKLSSAKHLKPRRLLRSSFLLALMARNVVLRFLCDLGSEPTRHFRLAMCILRTCIKRASPWGSHVCAEYRISLEM